MASAKYTAEVKSTEEEIIPLIESSSYQSNQDRESSREYISREGSTEYFKNMSKQTAMKNLIVVGIAHAVFFTGFAALSNLQSTMNYQKNIGVISQAIIYSVSMVSALFFPKAVINWLGCKRTLVLVYILDCFYIAANFYPKNWLLYIAAVVFGATSGPQLTAQTTYIQEISSRYAEQSPNNPQYSTRFFFSIFVIFMAQAQIWGNVISYGVLFPTTSSNVTSDVNVTAISEMSCGRFFNKSYVYADDPFNSNHLSDLFSSNLNDSFNNNLNLEPPTEQKRYILVGIYTALGLSAALVLALFLDPLKNDQRSKNKCKDMLANVYGTLKNMSTKNQLFLLPLSILVGFEIGFYQADFTQSFIACYLGVYEVGYVSMAFGISNAITAAFVGLVLVKQCPPYIVIFIGVFLNVLSGIFMVVWGVSAVHGYWALYAIAAFWGATDAIWWSHLSAIYSDIFLDNRVAGFSNMSFCIFLGYLLAFSGAALSVPMLVKIITLLLLPFLGVFMYMCVFLRSTPSPYERIP